MNKSFLVIFIPALLVAAMYLALGIYPPRRALIGVAVFAVGFAAYGVRVWMKRGKSAAQSDSPAPPAASATPPAGHS